MLVKRVALAAGAAVLGAGLVTAPSASAASSAACKQGRHLWSMTRHTVALVKYRTGPSTGCAALGQIPKGKKVYLWDTHGNHWQYVRIAGTNKRGWVATKYIGG